ncbi:Protein lifeguard 1 [Hondaea fermentalgiana]|uniref:Protein lifeguard 1 n=1 Tax=Hondaea fermentalgiana TaxID=2315210 RepID=A0A2R5GBQ2_9STRA|nr:Protein lifeguard 1 [Hondaea fermentalgiana]|eukprot:GBG27759.1 Protein lifeguard 1 [Hondaea fermentalgiana]
MSSGARQRVVVPQKFKRIVRGQVWRHGPIAGALDDLEALTARDRGVVWSLLFAWALPNDSVRRRYEVLANAEIPQQDLKQITRDVPRTQDCFRKHHDDETSENDGARMKQLERVLRAFVALGVEQGHGEHAIYVQGLNGIAFLLLEVLDSEAEAFAYLVGIGHKLLYSVFGGDTNLVDAQGLWDEVASSRHPIVASRCRDAGLLPGLLCVKWMMTMFTQVSFSGNTVALPFETVLACWDISLLMGMAGVACVMNGLFDTVAEAVRTLPSSACEDRVLDAVTALAQLTPAAIFERARGQLLQPDGADALLDRFRSALRKDLASSRAASELCKAVKPRVTASSGYLADWHAVRKSADSDKGLVCQSARETETKMAPPMPVTRPRSASLHMRNAQQRAAAAEWIQRFDPASGAPYFVHSEEKMADIERGRGGAGWGAQQYDQGNNAQIGNGNFDEDFEPMSAMDIQVRHGFIRKVFSILFIQLVVTFGIVIGIASSETVSNYVQTNTTVYYATLGIAFGCVLVLSCCSNVARTHPWGLIFLCIVTVCEGYVLGVVASFAEIRTVYMALGVTLAITVSLVVFSFQTKYDFTGMGPYLLVALIALLIFGIVLIFITESRTTYTIYAFLGVLLFSAFLVYDTQLIIGGKNRYQLSVDDYIIGALSLYLDVIYIFLYLVMALTGLQN